MQTTAPSHFYSSLDFSSRLPAPRLLDPAGYRQVLLWSPAICCCWAFHCLRKAAIFVSCSPSSRVLKLAAVVACVVVAVDRFPTLQVSLLLPWQ